MLRLLAPTKRVVPEIEYELQVAHHREPVDGAQAMPGRSGKARNEQHEAAVVRRHPAGSRDELRERVRSLRRGNIDVDMNAIPGRVRRDERGARLHRERPPRARWHVAREPVHESGEITYRRMDSDSTVQTPIVAAGPRFDGRDGVEYSHFGGAAAACYGHQFALGERPKNVGGISPCARSVSRIAAEARGSTHTIGQ